MKENNLRSVHRFKYKATTNSKHNQPIAENIVSRNFSAKAPDQLWLADITYVRTHEGWLYLAVILDVFSKRIVASATSKNINTTLVISALDKALRVRKPPRGLVFHSDRGVQYASNDFRNALTFAKITQSMSRKANAWDNAPTESFFPTLKKELIRNQIYDTRFHADKDIFNYIYAYYNTQRAHSSLNYLAPAEFEAALAA
jgi:transposase InsO family protein